MSVLVSAIQRSCFHDGPGIRTTVFFKGCSLHCPWCANPENISSSKELYYQKDLCVRRNDSCFLNKECSILGNQKKPVCEAQLFCPAKALTFMGTEYDEDGLLKALAADRTALMNGGLTFSGGEPYLQLFNVMGVLEYLKSMKIHLCTESALFVPLKLLERTIDFIDLMYIDIKSLEEDICRRELGGELEVFYRNLDFVFSRRKEVIFRFPMAYGITATEENLCRLELLLEKYRPVKFEYFFVHNLAQSKYQALGRKMRTFVPASNEFIHSLEKLLSERGIEHELLKIA